MGLSLREFCKSYKIDDQKVVAFYGCVLVVDGDKLNHHYSPDSSVPSKEIQTDLRKLIDKRFNESMIIPCITSSHLHLENASFPLKYISDLKNDATLLEFVEGFGIAGYSYFNSLTPLIERQLTYAIKLHSRIRTEGLIIPEEKLLGDIAKDFCLLELYEPTPATPSIAQQIGLNNLQIITTDDSLIRYFHDLIADYIKTPRSDEQLSKLKSLIVLCYDLKAVDKEGRSYNDPYKKNKYDDFVSYLGLPELSTADLFWTGKSMVKRSCIIGWNWKGIYTKDTSDKVEFHEFNASMVGYFLDSNKPERRQLVRFLESTDKEIEIPCITPTYIHLNNCSFPLKYLKGINNLGWLNFVEGLPICSYYVQQSITPLIERKLCFALGFHSIPYPIPEEKQKESLAQGFAKIDIESDLEQLKEQTNDGCLVRYFHDKILNYVSTPSTTHSEEELKKVKQLVKLIPSFVNMVTIDDLSKKRIYDDNVQILKIPQLSTADLFWTGRQMIQRQKIIGFYRCTIITDESNKIVHHTMIPSVHFPDETELDLRKLIDQRFNESMIIPCITPSHIHLENSLFPINWISNIEREPGNFLNFVKGFGIIAYRVDRSSLTPLIEEKLNCAIKLYSELRDQGRTIDDKLLNDIAEEFRRLESPQTPATPATQPIWNQSKFVDKAIHQLDKLITPVDVMNEINNLQKLDLIQSTFKGNYTSKFFDAIRKRNSTDFDLLMKEMDAKLKEGDLLKWYYSKMLSESTNTNTQTRQKLELFIIFCLDILDQSSCSYEQHQAIENLVQILGLDYLSTTNGFWTGAGMIPFTQIVAWYKRPQNKGTEFIIRQSPTEEPQELQVIKSKLHLSTKARAALVQELEKNNRPTDKLSLAIQRLIRFACPCTDTTQITFAYFNTESGSFPFKYVIDIDRTWLKVEGLPNISAYVLTQSEIPDETKTKIDRCISIHHLMRSIRELKDQYDNKFYDQIVQHLANESLPITTDSVMSSVDETQKLIDKCLPLHSEKRLTQLFTEFFTPPKPTPAIETKESKESTPSTQSTVAIEQKESKESKEPIWNQSFGCQVFIQRDQDSPSTFEEFYQALISKAEFHGFDKTKCHCLLFDSTDGKPTLWITVEGMTQDLLNTNLPKFVVGFYSFTQFNYEPHISPLMLKNAKPFRHSCVTVKNPASFFIHGDSSANWNSLYDSLGKGARTLMFASRKNGYLPGRTLYVVTDDIGAPTTEEFLETVNPLKEFIIPPNYSTQMIDIIIPTDRNDPELLKQYQKVN